MDSRNNVKALLLMYRTLGTYVYFQYSDIVKYYILKMFIDSMNQYLVILSMRNLNIVMND